MPTSKVSAGGLAGLLSTVIISELQNRFHIALSGDEGALITAIVSFAAAWITPHIPQPPAQ